MNTGIGDAVNLAWKLAAVLHGGARDSLLATYEPERIGFARRLVATTDRGFTVVTQQGVVARWVRTRLVPLIARSEEHTSELQSLRQLVCRLLLEKNNELGRPYHADLEAQVAQTAAQIITLSSPIGGATLHLKV